MKAAIFDMDGTLLDSMQMWYSFTPSFVEEYNLEMTPEIENELTGMGFVQAAELFCERFPSLCLDGEALLELWFDRLARDYREMATVKPHVIEYLEKLRHAGVPCAVATMTEHRLCDMALKHHGLDRFFGHILTYEDVGGVGKSRPDLFLEAARRLGFPPCDCAVFEDSLFAIKTARGAGFTVYGIDDRVQNAADRIRPLCHRFFSDFGELL